MKTSFAADAPGSAALAQRFALGPLQNPVRGSLHGTAALAMLAWAFGSFAFPEGLAFGERCVLALLGASHGALFATSALYHSLPWNARWKRRMQRLDHSMIYVKIAATLTAFAWVATQGSLRAAWLGAAWGIAAVGVMQKLLLPSLPERASIPVQLLHASLGVPLLVALAMERELAPLWLLSGPLCYGIGAVVFLTERPRLWPRVFSFHELFHLLLVIGSAASATALLEILARR